MPDRIILINKPLRWTSFDVVKKLKRPLLDEKRNELPPNERKDLKKFKVGHAGTLDPLASGLLVICTGKLTKKINEIQNAEKEYTGTITIGSVTESYDLESEPKNFLPFNHISEEKILSTAASMTGRLMQFPPLHSAKKVEGQRAYEKARKGIEFNLKPKEVTISEFEITSINLPEIRFRVVCSKGTYIRSLAHDFGALLATGGYLSELTRTRIGVYKLEDAITPQEFLDQLSGKQKITL